MTDIASLPQLQPFQKTLRALSIDTLEQFIAASQAAGLELRALLGTDLDTLVAPATALAQAMSAELAHQLADLPCALGAQTSPRESVADVVPSLPLAAVTAAGVCGPPLITSEVPIRSQGARGTCVAHAVVAALEYHLHTQGAAQDMSEQFLYWNAKNNDGSPTAEGTWISVAAPLVQRDGVCPEDV